MVVELEPQNSQEASFNRHYIRSKLEHGLLRVWGDVQAKVKVYILSSDLSHFQYDQFIQVLDVINRCPLRSQLFIKLRLHLPKLLQCNIRHSVDQDVLDVRMLKRGCTG